MCALDNDMKVNDMSFHSYSIPSQMSEMAKDQVEKPDCSDKLLTKRFQFTSDENKNGLCKLDIIISEVMRPEYGLYTWPSAVVLAQYVWHHREKFKLAEVLELASGTALPGIVAAKCGAKVKLSDSASHENCLRNCQRSIIDNGLSESDNVEVIRLTWGTFEPNILDMKNLDFLLASDCFYEVNDFEDILVTISFILERNINCKCLCTYQVRSSNWSIEHLLLKWKLRCDHIPVAHFGADCPNLAKSNLPGQHSIQMLVLTRSDSIIEVN